jgi:hypothetical protein
MILSKWKRGRAKPLKESSMRRGFMGCELKMQPGGLSSYIKVAWILKKQYIQCTGDYKNEKLYE